MGKGPDRAQAKDRAGKKKVAGQARELRALLTEYPMLGEWLLRWDVASGRVQLAARGATAHLIVAVAPQEATITLFSDAVHVGYLVGDDIIVTASSPSGDAYA
jgi:hypothetical protein